MFGIGASELVVIVLVALVVVGPRKLPEALRSIGKALGQFRRATTDLRREVGYDEVVSEVTKPLRDGMASVQEEIRRVEGDVREGFSAKTLWGDEAGPLTANKKPEGLPPGGLPAGPPSDPYAAPSSSGLLEFAGEYPPSGPDDYAALPETANVYPELAPAAANKAPTSEGSPSQAIASLMKPGARES